MTHSNRPDPAPRPRSRARTALRWTARILVAVVPVKQIEQRFLSKINADPTLGATLIDDSYRAMATSRKELIGVNMLDASPLAHQVGRCPPTQIGR